MADNFRFAQLQPYALAGAGAIAGATSIILKSMLDIDGNTLSMSTDFGSIGYGTLEPGNGTQEEQISFTGLTNNANGTVTLSGVKTVDFQYPYTETSGLAKTHPGSSVFVISNTSGFYNKLVAKDDDATVTGTVTFTAVPASTAAPVSGDDLTNKTYVDALVNGGPVSMDQVVVAGTAGETVAAGNLVYLKSADGRWWLTDADTASTCVNVQLGIAQGAGTAGNAISGGVLIEGVDTNQSGLVAGEVQYVSNTAGGISNSAGTNAVAVGNAKSTTALYFQPNFNGLLTSGQKDAAAGNNGTPGTGNTYVTQTGYQRAQEIYAADSVGTDAYAITVTPTPAAYADGMVFRFKAGTANTGACTLAVSGLAATAIKRSYNVDTITGDIVQNQIVEVVYANSVFQMISPVNSMVTKVNAGNTTYDMTTASGTQTIAHGLGVVPKLVRISIKLSDEVTGQNNGHISITDASYTSSQNANYVSLESGGTSANTTKSGGDLVVWANPSQYQTGTITTDSTNINIAWVKTSTPTGTMYIIWEAFA